MCWCVSIVAVAADRTVSATSTQDFELVGFEFESLELEFQILYLGSEEPCCLQLQLEIALDNTWASRENLQMHCLYHCIVRSPIKRH